MYSRATSPCHSEEDPLRPASHSALHPRRRVVQQCRQVFWLTDRPTGRAFSPPLAEMACCGVRPRLQRRDRGGFAPPSHFQSRRTSGPAPRYLRFSIPGGTPWFAGKGPVCPACRRCQARLPAQFVPHRSRTGMSRAARLVRHRAPSSQKNRAAPSPAGAVRSATESSNPLGKVLKVFAASLPRAEPTSEDSARRAVSLSAACRVPFP